MTSQYLDLPNRSEAEAVIDRIDRLRLQVVSMEQRIRLELKAMGAGEADLCWLDFTSCFNDAASSIEQPARDAIEEADLKDEIEHIDYERSAYYARVL